jgi:3-methyladenine DNA glycosylase AlkD
MTDGLGWVLAFWMLGDPDTRLGYLEELISDEDVWSRRLALVATTSINRGHTGYTIPDLTLDLVDRAKDERHPMITKAVSWALREMTKSHPDRVVAYLEANRGVLAVHVVREINNKLRTGLKSGKAGS